MALAMSGAEARVEMLGKLRRGTRWGVAAALAAGLVLTAAGCAPRGGDAGGDASEAAGEGRQVKQFAIVTPEKESDYGWNQQGIWAARAAADELGITLDDYSNAGYDNTETILTQVAEGGADFIIAHASGFNAAGARVGEQTGVPTLVVDFEKNRPGKVGTVVTRGEQGAYLAGVAAAKTTQSKTVGVVASAEDLNWFLMSGGFAQGVRSVDPTIKIVIAYVGPAGYGDSAGGTNVMNQVIAAGADVIMGMGDGATIGYLQAVESAKSPVHYIATIGDVSEIVQDRDAVLASVLWNFTDTYVQAIRDIANGTFGTKTYELTVANGGLSLNEGASVSEDAAAAVAAARAGIIDGSIEVTRATDKDAVQALIDGK